MTDAASLDALIQAAAAQNGVPAALLKSVGIVETGLNPHQGASGIAPAVGNERGTGMMQLTPSTASAMGVDPSDPAASIGGAAKYLRQGYDATGNWDDAARYYHGGPDPKNWGPRTADYHDKVLAAAQGLTGGGGAPAPAAPQPAASSPNPFLAMASAAPATGGAPAPAQGQPAQPSGNPFLAMAQGGNGAGDGSLDQSGGANGAGVPSAGGDSVRVGVPGGPPQGAPGGSGGLLATAASYDPLANAIVNGGSLGTGLRQAAGGLVSGALSVPETAAALTASGLDKLGVLPGSADTLRRADQTLQNWGNTAAGDPKSPIARSRELAGAILASLPVSEIAPFGEVAPEAKGIAATLRRVANMSSQGAAAGVATSRGDNVGQNALIGAVAAPALGAAISKVMPVVMRASNGAADLAGNSRIAQALRRSIGGDAGAAAGDAAAVINPAGRPDIHFDPQTMAAMRKAYPELKDLTDQQFADMYGRSRTYSADQVDGGEAPPAAQQTIQRGSQINAPAATAPAGQPAPADLVAALRANAAAPGAEPAAPAGEPGAAPPASAPPEAPTQAQAAPAAVPQVPVPQNPATVAAAAGDQQGVADALRNAGDPTSVSAQTPIAANDLGSRGARVGLEANTDLPPEVAQHAQALIADGLPRDQALREAEITAVGAKPTLADVTRNPADQRGKWEGAKMDTPEGQQLATQIAGNNAALHDTVQKLVQSYGGAPAQGETAESAAKALAADSDRIKAGVSQRYAEAEATDGEAYADPSDIYAVLTNPTKNAAINPKAGSFLRAMKQRLDLLTGNGKRGLKPQALELLRKGAVDAYDEVGSPEVRARIGDATHVIDEAFKTFDEAGPTYAKARAAHEAWAQLYQDPRGVADLIQRDAHDRFVQDGNWRKAESGFVGSMADRPFAEIVNQLRDLRDNAGGPVLDKMKASVVQRAYQAATGSRAGNAVDLLGNSHMSGKLFLAELNKIGMPKLQALFSKAEIGRLASIGRAASHINEAVPGTVNTSGTASTLLNALGAMKAPEKASLKGKVGKGIAHLVLGHVTGGAGNIALEGVSHAAGLAKAASARAEVAEQLRRAANPTLARAAEREEASAAADKLRRALAARQISNQTAPVTGAIQERNR